jgi:CspA family cold shock protein
MPERGRGAIWAPLAAALRLKSTSVPSSFSSGIDVHEVKVLEAMMTGKVRTLRVDKGFGFIRDDGGNEYFFHQSAVYGEGLQDLREGDSVEFDVGQGPKGPRAENVRRTST